MKIQAHPPARFDTNFLRFVGILLVINSHADLFYPIAALATGGAIGNTLFFALSSFGLLISERKRPTEFIPWMTRRVVRIYPTLWVILVLLVIPVDYAFGRITLNEDFLRVLGWFFYPDLWFLQALIVYYIAIFFVIKNYTLRKTLLISGGFATFYLWWYVNLDLSQFVIEDVPFKVSFYILTFIFGVYLADINERIKYQGILDYILFGVSVAVLYGHKLLMNQGMLAEFQIVQQMALFPTVFYAFKLARSPLVAWLMRVDWLARAVTFVSNITLELYIVHLALEPVVLSWELPFPINMLVFLGLSFGIAYGINRLTAYLLSKAPPQFLRTPKPAEAAPGD